MKTIRILLSIIFSVALIFSVTGVSFGGDFFEKNELKTIKGPKWSPGEILVKFKRGVSESSIQKANQKHEVSVLSKSRRGEFLRLRIPPTKTVEEMVEIYNKNPNVEYAEPNFMATALFVPNDPFYTYQWNFHDADGGIYMESAWDLQTGSTSVIVAVIDTGVAYENYGRKYKLAPDLAGTSFVPGYDFVNNDTHPNDDDGHGTHVTGTIAQRTNNSLGVAGIAFNVSIMPVKVLDSNGSGTYAGIADGIYFAADNGAKVINMSLGGSSSSTTLRNALAYAYNIKGVTIVCAAGNEYQSGNDPSYPAAYDDYCIAVGATRFDETRSYYSNTGSYVDIMAPGGDTSVDQNGDGYVDGILQQTFGSKTTIFGYYFYQGTSMASPHVAGVAALLISNGVTGPDNVRKALQETAVDKGPAGWDPQFGWGIVDAHAALTYGVVKVHDIAITNMSVPASANQGDLVDVIVTVVNEGDYTEGPLTVSLKMDSIGGENIGSQTLTLAAKQLSDLTFSWDTGTASIGDHMLIAVADTVPGESDTLDNILTNAITITDPSDQHEIHVAGITMNLSRKGRNYQAIAHVSIADESGKPVSGVTVTGDWKLNNTTFLNTASNITGSDGSAALTSKNVKARSGDTFSITITGLSKAGYAYNPASNIETSDFIIVP